MTCFQTAFHLTHTETVGDRRKDLQGFQGDAVLFLGGMFSSQVVQAIGELDKDDAYIRGHRQKHFAQVLDVALDAAVFPSFVMPPTMSATSSQTPL